MKLPDPLPAAHSAAVPNLRLVFDSTCLSALMCDPLTYHWRYNMGWRIPGTALALLWGTLWHEGVGRLHAAWEAGTPRDEAVRSTVAYVLAAAKREGLDAIAAEAPDKERKTKNAFTLARALVWYDCEWRGQYRTYRLDDGTLAIEHRFCVPLLDRDGNQLTASTGEGYWLSGSMDQVVVDEVGRMWLLERKTTGNTMGLAFWSKYNPSPQVNTYAAVGARLFGDKVAGVMLEGLQTAVGFSRFDWHEVTRTPGCHAAWMDTVVWWVRLAERLAVEDKWIQAVNLAYPYHATTFKRIFQAPAHLWEQLLAMHCERGEIWNPLTKA